MRVFVGVCDLNQQVAEHFADLHDTPGRMHAKKVIRKVRHTCWTETPSETMN